MLAAGLGQDWQAPNKSHAKKKAADTDYRASFLFVPPFGGRAENGGHKPHECCKSMGMESVLHGLGSCIFEEIMRLGPRGEYCESFEGALELLCCACPEELMTSLGPFCKRSRPRF